MVILIWIIYTIKCSIIIYYQIYGSTFCLWRHGMVPIHQSFWSHAWARVLADINLTPLHLLYRNMLLIPYWNLVFTLIILFWIRIIFRLLRWLLCGKRNNIKCLEENVITNIHDSCLSCAIIKQIKKTYIPSLCSVYKSG